MGFTIRPERCVVAGVALVALLSPSCSSHHGGALPLTQVADVPFPGPANRFDYMSLDPSTETLWIAHMDASEVLGLDVRSRHVMTIVRGVPSVHGLLAVPAVHRVFASATDAHELFSIDERTGKIVTRTPAGAYPDGIAYAPPQNEVFVSDEVGGVETVVDAATGRRVATVPLGGEAGNVRYDPASRLVLVDVQTRNVVAVIDPATDRIVRRIPLPGCDHDHGLYVDPAHELAFVACDGNARLLVLDLRSDKVLQDFPTGPDPDVLAFDPGLERLYVSDESGVVAVFQENGSSIRPIGLGFLATEAHTVAVDPKTHLAYFALEDVDGKPVLRIMAPRSR